MSGVPGTNTGHGHVWARPDGVKARCSGTLGCPECKADAKMYGKPAVQAEEPQKHAQSAWAVSAMFHEGCGDCMILAQPAAAMARVRGCRESTYTEHNHGIEHSVTVVRILPVVIVIHL